MWRKALVDVDARGSDAVQGVLLELGALGLEITDDETRAVPGRAVDPTGRALVVATFSQRASLEAEVIKALSHVAAHVDFEFDVQWSDLEPRDWNAEFKASWQPLELSPAMWIAPSWSADFEPPQGAHCIRMDPGMAFGTGTHATTQLCARALEAHLAKRAIARLLDVGTGTGVLSITALMLGARTARGTEIEDAAVRASTLNAEENDVGARFSADLEKPDHDGAIYDACVANILATPLMSLAPPIARALKPGSPLWLSGLLEDQRAAVTTTYLDQGFSEVGSEVQGGWVRLDLVRD